MGGLGYLEVLEDLSYKGPIDKFIPEELKGEIRELAGLLIALTVLFWNGLNVHLLKKSDKSIILSGFLRSGLSERS